MTAKILKILRVDDRTSKKGEPYKITVAILDSGEEIEGYGTEFEAGDKVYTYFNDRWNRASMEKFKQ